jgi:predicted ATPase
MKHLSIAFNWIGIFFSISDFYMSLFRNRFGQRGIYILEEPEAALSPQKQLAFLSIIHELQKNAQVIIATHSPILLGYPYAEIYNFNVSPIKLIAYEETEHYQITRRFLENKNFYLKELID